MSSIRDYLVNTRPPSNRILRNAARLKGLDLVERASSFARVNIDEDGTYSCYRTGLGPTGLAVEEQLVSSMKEASIPFFRGAGSDVWLKSFHIASRDTRLVVDLITATFAVSENVFVLFSDGSVVNAKKLKTHPRRYRQSAYRLLCAEQVDQASKVMACSWIEISIWKEIPAYSSDRVYETASINPHVRRLRRATLEDYLSKHVDVDLLDPLLNAVPRFPIDVVYTWVDDKDPEWQRSRAFHSGRSPDTSASSRSNLDERFTNRDELKYSLRSIELFAPFVRNIYLVTCGHAPSWLKENHPRLKLVSHREIFKDPKVLPTFNSSAIETQLHHIDGLSDHFLYFNDDFFLGEFCKPEDFFHSNGVIKFFTGEQKSFEHDIDDSSEEYISADKNAIELLKGHSQSFTRDLMIHAPYPASRTILYELEHKFEDAFSNCAKQRFRSHGDLRPIAFMQYHYGYHAMKAIKDTITNRYLALWKPGIDQMFSSMLRNRRYKTFCLNDVGIPSSRVNWTNRQVNEFLEQYFPFKSSFEK